MADGASSQKKADSGQNTLDEIDQIMNEIEALQKSMLDSQQVSTSPQMVSTPAASVTAEAPAVVDPAAQIMETQNTSLSEFQEGRSDTSIEDTLGSLKDEEPAKPNLLDEAVAVHATVQETPHAGSSRVVSIEDYKAPTETHRHRESESMSESKAEVARNHIGESNLESLHEQHLPSASGRPSAELRLSGEMELRLSYEYSGQEVSIRFQDGFLCVELTDGTEFKIPVRARAA